MRRKEKSRQGRVAVEEEKNGTKRSQSFEGVGRRPHRVGIQAQSVGNILDVRPRANPEAPVAPAAVQARMDETTRLDQIRLLRLGCGTQGPCPQNRVAKSNRARAGDRQTLVNAKVPGMGKYTEYLQANNRAYIAVEIPKALRAHLDAEAGGKADARFIRELMAKATGFAGDPHAGFSTKKGVHEAGRKLAQSNRPEHTGAKAARLAVEPSTAWTPRSSKSK